MGNRLTADDITFAAHMPAHKILPVVILPKNSALITYSPTPVVINENHALSYYFKGQEGIIHPIQDYNLYSIRAERDSYPVLNPELPPYRVRVKKPFSDIYRYVPVASLGCARGCAGAEKISEYDRLIPGKSAGERFYFIGCHYLSASTTKPINVSTSESPLFKKVSRVGIVSRR